MTGYADFEYAQQAVRLGAFDFITKPFSMEDVLEVVWNARDQVLVEKSLKVQHSKLQAKVNESMPVLRQEYFRLLVHHRANEQEVSRRWDFLEMDLSKNNLAVMVAEVDQFRANRESLAIGEVELTYFAIHNILEETIRSFTKGYVIRESVDRILLIYNTNDNDLMESLAESCYKNCLRYARKSISIGVGNVADTVQTLPDSYQEANTALTYHFYTGDGGVIRYSDIANYQQSNARYPAEEEKDMAAAILLGNEELALAILDRLYKQIRSDKPLSHPLYQSFVLFGIANVLIRSLLEKVAYEEVSELESRVRELQGRGISVIEEAYHLIRLICQEGCRLINSRLSTETYQLIERALRYIEEHLHAELTVNQCASHVYLSGSYFASLFKKVTGKRFSQYVTELKINKAKQMLVGGNTIQDIASALGYEERRNFSDMFKKMTGMTPSEYRATLGYAPGSGGDEGL
ncbi:helix-turn-helix domain-containing protein [Paenibacillus sp. BIHB 4019]|uniref:helix-turn-helix domain-containing protein n=1 Tax=Paenibacillus sp. BIHB 4019 TaxID=1870819 RepID=UPI0015597A91|nr:helix-turn-helix domain-containing protein [Paenibacillus sp. BIHB 4019]